MVAIVSVQYRGGTKNSSRQYPDPWRVRFRVDGWESAKMAEHYRMKAQQKRLAADAMPLIKFDAAIA
jgi:hypothetical protein